MSHLKDHWFPYLLGLIAVIVVINGLSHFRTQTFTPDVNEASIVPDLYSLTNSAADDQIRFGKDLVDNTAKYFGPRGSVAHISNGLNCENCHRESGTKLYSNNFLTVASTYPKYRERSGRSESVEWRINECMQRSLNGEAIDSLSKEMRAMVAYINWTGKNVHKNEKAAGAENKELPFLERAADPGMGHDIYNSKCISCHAANGEGVALASGSYLYPPLWGEHSYAVSAGMYRITKCASFIKNNMPLGATYAAPQLTDAEAWDLAAYINSQPHPQKIFAGDWPGAETKPVDYPFGPYVDGFPEQQHKYGPFIPIKNAKDIAVKK